MAHMINQETINLIKEKLLSEKTRLEDELSRLGKKSTDENGNYQAAWEEYGTSEEENAAEVTAYTDSLGLTYELEQALKEVDESLERITEGTYGVCAKCEQDIAEPRLMARPSSILCITCQEKVEHP